MLWHGFDPWPRNFCKPPRCPKKGKVIDILILKIYRCGLHFSCLAAFGTWITLSSGTPRRMNSSGFILASAGAAVTKHHRLGGVNNRTLSFHSSGGWRPGSGCQQSWLQRPRGGSVPGLSPWLVDGRLLSSRGLLCLCPVSSFLQGHQSCWARTHPDDLILTELPL